MPSVEVSARSADEIIGTAITHHADASGGQQHGEGLLDRALESGIADLFEKHLVGLAQMSRFSRVAELEQRMVECIRISGGSCATRFPRRCDTG
jgi:hypothetical protein